MYRGIRAKLLLPMMFCLAAWLPAAPAWAGPDPESEARRIEANLLSRRLDLGGVRTWSQQQHKWLELASPHAALIVLHLWAVECKPCVAELPVLEGLVEGWRSHADAQFLLVSETESEDQLLEFWQHHRAAGSSALPLHQVGDERLRTALETGRQPLTLILDQSLVVRQAFVGSIAPRTTELTAGMLRLLETVHHSSAAPVRHALRKRAL